MRRLLPVILVIVALLTIAPEPMLARRVTITLVGSAYSGATANDNTITISGSSGDLLLVIGGIINTAQTLTISDNLGSTFLTCPAGTLTNTGVTLIGIQARYVVLGGALTTVTLTSSGAGSTYGAAVVYSGTGAVSCDASGTAEDDATQSHGGAISVSATTTNDTVLFGGIGAATAMTVDVPAAGYTQATGTAPDRFFASYKVVNATSANGYANHTAANEDTVSVLMAIKTNVAAAGGSTTCHGMLLGVGC